MSETTLQTIMDIIRPFAGSKVELTPDLPLLESGLIDSATMVNILLELESRLGLQLDAADLSFDHFQSCRVLAEVFSARLNA